MLAKHEHVPIGSRVQEKSVNSSKNENQSQMGIQLGFSQTPGKMSTDGNKNAIKEKIINNNKNIYLLE